MLRQLLSYIDENHEQWDKDREMRQGQAVGPIKTEENHQEQVLGEEEKCIEWRIQGFANQEKS